MAQESPRNGVDLRVQTNRDIPTCAWNDIENIAMEFGISINNKIL